MRRYGAVIGAVALVLVVGVGGFASATTTCETFTNHGGQVPAGWTATFYENGQAYGPVVGPGYLAPSTAGEDNRSWDKAIKCRTTTTTIEEPTTTTTEEGTTTTVDDTTTTTTTITGPSTTTTLEGSTSTIDNGTTTTTGAGSTSTTPPVPPSTVPTDPSTPELPYTGAGSVVALILAASSLIGGGVALLRRRG